MQMPFGDSYGQGRSAVLMSELGSLTCVEAVAGGPVPLNMGYGNNITIPGHEDAIINISDLYYATSGWFGIMGVDILEGEDFSASASVPEDVMVDENLAEQIRRPYRKYFGTRDLQDNRGLQAHHRGQRTLAGQTRADCDLLSQPYGNHQYQGYGNHA